MIRLVCFRLLSGRRFANRYLLEHYLKLVLQMSWSCIACCRNSKDRNNFNRIVSTLKCIFNFMTYIWHVCLTDMDTVNGNYWCLHICLNLEAMPYFCSILCMCVFCRQGSDSSRCLQLEIVKMVREKQTSPYNNRSLLHSSWR